MPKHRGTTTSASKFFVDKSRSSRPATGGNKNLGPAGAQMPGGSQGSRVDGVIAANLKGPFLGS